VLYLLLKFVATWIGTWSAAPAVIFAPSLAEQQLLRIQHSPALAKPDTYRAEAVPGH
jgi:hypothetical protein